MIIDDISDLCDFSTPTFSSKIMHLWCRFFSHDNQTFELIDWMLEVTHTSCDMWVHVFVLLTGSLLLTKDDQTFRLMGLLYCIHCSFMNPHEVSITVCCYISQEDQTLCLCSFLMCIFMFGFVLTFHKKTKRCPGFVHPSLICHPPWIKRFALKHTKKNKLHE